MKRFWVPHSTISLVWNESIKRKDVYEKIYLNKIVLSFLNKKPVYKDLTAELVEPVEWEPCDPKLMSLPITAIVVQLHVPECSMPLETAITLAMLLENVCVLTEHSFS